MGRKKRIDTKGVVYLISFPNGKKYVGITTTSFEERKASHISHMNTSGLAVHQALKTFFGRETWEVIASADSWKQLVKIEIEMIDKYKSHISNNGYNLTLGGDGTVGYTHSEEQKQKNRNSRIQYFSDKKNREKQSIANKIAHQKNPEQGMEHSKFQKKRFTDPTERRKVAAGVSKFLSDDENLKLHSIQRGAKPFCVRKINGEFVGEWLTQHSCARELDLSVSHINSCLHGRRKSHKGFMFSYISEKDDSSNIN